MARQSHADGIGIGASKLCGPFVNGLIANYNPAIRENILDQMPTLTGFTAAQFKEIAEKLPREL